MAELNLERRRAANRKSQQRSREAKDSLIRRLIEENERLKAPGAITTQVHRHTESR